MGCGRCSGSHGAAGSSYPTGGVIAGYEVTYADGTKAPNLFDTAPAARKHARLKGGTIRQVVR